MLHRNLGNGKLAIELLTKAQNKFYNFRFKWETIESLKNKVEIMKQIKVDYEVAEKEYKRMLATGNLS